MSRINAAIEKSVQGTEYQLLWSMFTNAGSIDSTMLMDITPRVLYLDIFSIFVILSISARIHSVHLFISPRYSVSRSSSFGDNAGGLRISSFSERSSDS